MTGLVMLHATLGSPAAARVRLDDDFVSASGGSVGGSTARWRQNAAGTVQTKQGLSAYVTPYNWLLTGANTDYQIRATIVSNVGIAPTGTFNTWMDTNTDHEWTQTSTVGSVSVSNIKFEIRDKVTLAVLASCNVDFDSEFI